jgi:uncharacterized protein (DUF1499 family)
MDLKRALTRNRAATAPDHPNPRMRGRRYAIPFQEVWETVLALVGGGLRGWTLVEADDVAGRIRAEARTLLFRFTDDVEIRVRLDRDAQTRVDLVSASRVGKADLGVNARRIRRFLRCLDRELDVVPWEVLAPEEGVGSGS